MSADGNYVPKFQLEQLLEDLQEAKKLTEASRILVNGDLKTTSQLHVSPKEAKLKIFWIF